MKDNTKYTKYICFILSIVSVLPIFAPILFDSKNFDPCIDKISPLAWLIVSAMAIISTAELIAFYSKIKNCFKYLFAIKLTLLFALLYSFHVPFSRGMQNANILNFIFVSVFLMIASFLFNRYL